MCQPPSVHGGAPGGARTSCFGYLFKVGFVALAAASKVISARLGKKAMVVRKGVIVCSVFVLAGLLDTESARLRSIVLN